MEIYIVFVVFIFACGNSEVIKNYYLANCGN